MRLFIALPLPQPVKRKLVDLQKPIKGVRWQSSDQIHLTLKFIGDSDQELFEKLNNVLGEIKHPSFLIDINGMGYFPENEYPRILWAGVKENKRLKQLYDKVEKSCVSLGIKSENRSFKPHITLGRLKGASKGDVLTFLEKHEKVKITDIPVNEFVLYESKPDPDGVRYSRRKTFQLTVDD